MSDKEHLYVVKGISREALVDIAYRAGALDAVKHIRAELDWYHKSYNSEYSDRDFKHRFITAIRADLKQADGESNKT